MSSPDDDEGSPASRQHRVDGEKKTTKQASQPLDQNEQLEVARRFLQHADVKSASRDQKAAFLKSKGISSDDVAKVLRESGSTPEAASQPDDAVQVENPPSAPLMPTTDRPPVVTYPEFLVKAKRPPPFVTKDGLLSTMYAFVGLSTLLYGASKYAVEPMVESLTQARTELHDVAHSKLGGLVARLETTVSVLPSAGVESRRHDDSDVSDAEDPTEMFHRDIGTQTSLMEDRDRVAAEEEPASHRHAGSLNALTKNLRLLRDQLRAQSEGLEDVKTLLDAFRDDLDGLTYGGVTELVGNYDLYGSSRKNEPEDEIRKVRDNIRRVKGLLLSTRSFPASTR